MKVPLYRLIMALAGLSMAIATGLGAWASHGLDGVLDPASLRSFEIGVDYQFVHSLGLILVALIAGRSGSARMIYVAAVLLLAGILLFCGGVYNSALGGPDWITGFAPTGGVSLIVGWLVFAGAVFVGSGRDPAN